MSESIEQRFNLRPFNAQIESYKNITKKEDIALFIQNVLIQEIFNETIKEYTALTEGYHYISGFNYFMGIRLTHNRAELIQDPTDTSTKKLIRKRDYQGTASQSFSDVVESPFGRNSTAYQSGGGFNNKGGYVHHFANDLTLQKANQTYQDLITDGLFDQNFLSLALEVVFYNENYQAGTVLIYQFLENNAGRVESYKDRRAFFESRYNSNYHQQSKSMVSFLIFLDAVYWLGLFWITFDAVKKVYNIVVTLIRFR